MKASVLCDLAPRCPLKFTFLHITFLLDLFLYPEDEGNMCLRNFQQTI
jgi:hypothetical protein